MVTFSLVSNAVDDNGKQFIQFMDAGNKISADIESRSSINEPANQEKSLGLYDGKK